ncbi:MAG TPA: DUF1844 domain-containing protein [Thermoanaerobaculia bacterium]|nr:DUF1844 domain-containing protein [Thermoanaerobaculia bacterium]
MDESPRIKVTDRRMFTQDGELREDAEELDSDEDGERDGDEEPARQASTGSGRAMEEPRRRVEEPASAGPSTFSSGPGAQPSAGAPGGEISFLDLVGLLAEPIALYLGDLAMPNGERTVDLDQARVYIDLLGILQEKTRGNLSREEEAVLTDLVYRLKMRYVQKRESA